MGENLSLVSREVGLDDQFCTFSKTVFESIIQNGLHKHLCLSKWCDFEPRSRAVIVPLEVVVPFQVDLSTSPST